MGRTLGATRRKRREGRSTPRSGPFLLLSFHLVHLHSYSSPPSTFIKCRSEAAEVVADSGEAIAAVSAAAVAAIAAASGEATVVDSAAAGAVTTSHRVPPTPSLVRSFSSPPSAPLLRNCNLEWKCA